jgi:hypothetical protein
MRPDWWLPGVVGAWAFLIAVAIGLTVVGIYGWALFAVLPLLMGALVERSRPVATRREALVRGGVTAVIGCLFFIVAGLEGLLCMVMSLPLAVPLGMAGSWLSFKLRSTRGGGRTMAMLLLPVGAGSAGYDVAAVPREYQVTTSIEIAATPDTVWRHVIAYSDLPQPTDWVLRTGIGYPTRVRLQGEGVGATRYCDFSTGSFVEPITVWEPGKRLEFDVVESASPMKEWSPYGEIHPRHLHGYFVSRRGRFVLKALPSGHTLVEGTSWYEHGLEPGPYWRWWTDAVVHRIHRQVLGHIKQLSES